MFLFTLLNFYADAASPLHIIIFFFSCWLFCLHKFVWGTSKILLSIYGGLVYSRHIASVSIRLYEVNDFVWMCASYGLALHIIYYRRTGLIYMLLFRSRKRDRKSEDSIHSIFVLCVRFRENCFCMSFLVWMVPARCCLWSSDAISREFNGKYWIYMVFSIELWD